MLLNESLLADKDTALALDSNDADDLDRLRRASYTVTPSSAPHHPPLEDVPQARRHLALYC